MDETLKASHTHKSSDDDSKGRDRLPSRHAAGSYRAARCSSSPGSSYFHIGNAIQSSSRVYDSDVWHIELVTKRHQGHYWLREH
ncbi:hypothetical protein WJX74_002062 [Apatococcus lobatus]|uniref:Uncharacterized protein n=1 Tax=Apatococcus lobatus TaxID=904363 RepID=A0AAW1SFT2_9CHLO